MEPRVPCDTAPERQCPRRGRSCVRWHEQWQEGGDAAAALIHPPTRLAKRRSRSERCWRAQRTLLLTELCQGTRDGDWRLKALCQSRMVQGTRQHVAAQTARILLIAGTFIESSNRMSLLVPGPKDEPRAPDPSAKEPLSCHLNPWVQGKLHCKDSLVSVHSLGTRGDTVTPDDMFLVRLHCTSDLSIPLSSFPADEYSQPARH